MHFLSDHLRRHAHGVVPLKRPVGAVRVVWKLSHALLAKEAVHVLRVGTRVLPLPKDFYLNGAKDLSQPIEPSGVFVVTVETHDPQHFVADIPLDLVEETLGHRLSMWGYEVQRAQK